MNQELASLSKSRLQQIWFMDIEPTPDWYNFAPKIYP